jgi:hypothetical protein
MTDSLNYFNNNVAYLYDLSTKSFTNDLETVLMLISISSFFDLFTDGLG